jgi:zinc protease
VKKTVRKGIEPKSSVQILFCGPLDWSPKNEAVLEFMGSVLDRKLHDVIREDLSGTYGVGVGADVSRYPRCEYTLRISFGCAPDRLEELRQAVFTQIDSLKAFGIDDSYVKRVQETDRRWHEREIKMNGVWSYKLAESYFYADDPATLFQDQKLIDAMDSKTVQDAARKYIDVNNYVEVDLMPDEKK